MEDLSRSMNYYYYYCLLCSIIIPKQRPPKKLELLHTSLMLLFISTTSPLAPLSDTIPSTREPIGSSSSLDLLHRALNSLRSARSLGWLYNLTCRGYVSPVAAHSQSVETKPAAAAVQQDKFYPKVQTAKKEQHPKSIKDALWKRMQ